MLDIQERVRIERIVAKDGLRFGFLVWLAVRIALTIWGALVTLVVPLDLDKYIFMRHPGASLPTQDWHGYMVGVWDVFDTRHYVTIANSGYGSDPDYLTAFFPGFPMLIKVGSWFLGGDSVLAAIVVANVAAIFFFWYLYRLVEADYGEQVAKRAVILSAVFPTSFFLFMGYTEAPLLAFTVASFYYGRQHKWWLAGLLAGCAALVKQPGVFLLLPLGYMYWRQYAHHRNKWSVFKKMEWAWLLLCPATAFAYMLYKSLFVNVSYNGVTDLGASEMLVIPGLPLVKALLAIRPDNPLLAANIMEIGFTILMIGLVAALALKIRSTTYTIYSFVIALVSLCVTWPDEFRPEADIPRRLLIIFPIFIYMAVVIQKPRTFRYFAYISGALFLSMAGLFTKWVFVS
jgi:hypothetical protein